MESEDAYVSSVFSVSEKRRLFSIEEVFSVLCNPFGGFPKTSSGPSGQEDADWLTSRASCSAY